MVVCLGENNLRRNSYIDRSPSALRHQATHLSVVECTLLRMQNKCLGVCRVVIESSRDSSINSHVIIRVILHHEDSSSRSKKSRAQGPTVLMNVATLIELAVLARKRCSGREEGALILTIGPTFEIEGFRVHFPSMMMTLCPRKVGMRCAPSISECGLEQKLQEAWSLACLRRHEVHTRHESSNLILRPVASTPQEKTLLPYLGG